ncbi:hypothetical protein JXA63_00840 [Candidatus Woesebacteria bacterium]|nr:hypothetical protein [Candidatus Woesebacteria bacterium]
MKIFGGLLIIFGSVWTLWRLLKQPEMFRITRQNKKDKGKLSGIITYIFSETFGLWPSLLIIYFGLKMTIPGILPIFTKAVYALIFALLLLFFGLI